VIYTNYRTNLKQSQLKEVVLNEYPFFEQVTMYEFEDIVEEMEANPDRRNLYNTEGKF